LCCGLILACALPAFAADTAKRTFDVPAGSAGDTLKRFAQQAGREIMFPSEPLNALRTNAVKGDLGVADALKQLLDGTELAAQVDPKSGAIVVTRAAVPNAPRAAQNETSGRPSDSASGEVVTLSTFQVTGSRITRLEGEGPQPTAAYSGDEIAARGYVSTGDFVQSLSFNSGTTNSLEVQSTNPVSNVPFARGAVTMNPRGLGANRFLVLLDGKRPSAYGLADSRGGSVFDFNSIPAEAIESIEYLKDGASAIYGSDAIAGVMNIKLRRSHDGLTAYAYAGNTLGHDSLTTSLSVLTGGSLPKGRYLVNVNWFKQNSNFARDYDRSQSTDYSFFPAPRAQNNNSTSNWPFNITLSATQATAAGLPGAGAYVITGGQPAATPTIASFTRLAIGVNATTNANRYDFAPTTQLVPDQLNYSALFNISHDFSPHLTANARFLYSKNTTDMVFTPISINSAAIRTSDGNVLTVPVGNPFNPFGIPLDNFRGRGNFGPSRTFAVDSVSTTALVDFEGRLGADWKWSLGAVRSEGLVDQVAGNQIRNDDMQRALNGTLSGFTGQFFNPFGPSNQALINTLFVSSVTNSRSTTTSGELSATGPLFELPAFGGDRGGQAAFAVGLEWRTDRLVNNSDPVGYLVAVGDQPYRGSRTVQSAYAELDLPLFRKYLSFQLAARYDHYDSFGNTTNPKYALISQPFDFLKLRASYSKTFKAPEIGQLFQPPVTTFTTAIVDPLNPGLGTNIYPFIASGNRGLQPERGNVKYAGAVVDLNRWVKGLSFSADYFDITLNNVITSFTNPATFFNSFPHLVVRNGAGGPIQFFRAQTINAAGFRWKGADFGLDYHLRKTALGDFSLNTQATYIDYFALNAGAGGGYVSTAGRYNNPRLTGTGSLGWKRGQLAATFSAQYKGSYLMDQFAPAWREGAEYLFNGSFTFDAPWRSRVTIGCNNLLDTDPPQNGRAIPSLGFDIATYSAWSMGRFVYVKVRKEF